MVYVEVIRPRPSPNTSSSIKKLALVASIAAGVQYGWALQLTLLTPYIQLLGVRHIWVSFIWLCGPLSGLIMQPIVGCYSDRCTSRFGRRRPFIMVGGLLLCIGVLLIAFAADIGHVLGDSLAPGTKTRAVTIFVLGFWVLDIANNVIQGPCRALLADLSGDHDAKVTIANALFSFFMAVGNVLGYAAGASISLYSIMPFTKTEACDKFCANLKTSFLFSILFTTFIIALVVILVKEEHDPSFLPVEVVNGEEKAPSVFEQLIIATRSLSQPMWILYISTALNWVGWFPFLLYDTDWMGREVYGGSAQGTSAEVNLYDQGVREGSLGLMLYTLTMAFVSLMMEPLVRVLGNVRRLWGIGNFILAFCMGLTVFITKSARDSRREAANQGNELVFPSAEIRTSCLMLFIVLGIPQAVTYSIPFALSSIYSNDSGGGQALAMGLLNLAIVIPQMLVALVIGPLDALFGGSNTPAFLLGGIGAAIGGIITLTKLPS